MVRRTAKKSHIKSIAIGVFVLVAVLALSVTMFVVNIKSAAALEQAVRCGIEEHVHTDSCYDGDFLVCKKQAHTHDGNCYIVLLGENNIDTVLDLTDNDSLEGVIGDVVDANRQDSDAVWTRDEVVSINSQLSHDTSLPDLVLNENINTGTAVTPDQSPSQQPEQDAPSQSIPEQNTQQGGQTISGNYNPPQLLDVGDKPSSNSQKANFYVYIDRQWQCIGTLDYTLQANGSRYNDYIVSTSAVVDLLNHSLGTSYSYNDFDVSVATSQSGSYTTSNVGVGSVNTTIAYRQRTSSSTAARYVRIIPVNGGATSTAFGFYSVTLKYPDGSTVVKYIRTNAQFTFPSGSYTWSDGYSTYSAGQTININNTSTFTATAIGSVTFININYNVAFPSVSGISVTTAPTIAGLTVSTVTDGYSENASAVIRNVSEQSVRGIDSSSSVGLSRIIQFMGWRVNGTDVIISPNTTLTWDELKNYAVNASVNLTAVWDYNALQTASFYIRFDSVAVDSDGNITNQDSNKYTKELFAAYVGGVDTSLSTSTLNNRYSITDTADNSYGADQQIRALYGKEGDGVWLSAIPSDDQIFADLVEYAQTGYLSVDGVPVKVEDLHSRAYAIRWYVFKSQSDAWHIDGKLVKKEGLIYLYKSFAGNKELIDSAKQNFYVDAFDSLDNRHIPLYLSDSVSYDDATDTYKWEISGVEYGEPWVFTENTALVNNDEQSNYVFAEYRVTDARGDQSRSGVGETVSVNGMTYALDEGDADVLKVEFNNIYTKSNSIVIKKQDSRTGSSIGGATFSLLQNNKLLKFTYDADSDKYIYDMSGGDRTVLDGTNNGYFEIAIESFSYDDGPITVREITPPEGYAIIGDIEIGYLEDGSIGILSGNSELISYVNGILIVGNSTDVLSVTAKKTWDCPETEWQPVTLELLANGNIVTSVIAGVTPEVVLDEPNGWTYMWNNLPVYVNGTHIEWSVREVAVGTERRKADGSFVNWLVSYALPVYTKQDGNTNILFTVTNTTKRVMLRITKTDLAMTTQLKGAAFRLIAVDANGDPLADEVEKNQTTGDGGTLIFDNLKSEVRYKLTEITPPDGYHRIIEDMYFTISETGAVRVEENYYVSPGTTAYNITVKNAKAVPLPESGGVGTSMFYIAGMMTMLAGVCIAHLFKRRCRS